jgi:hypothetical protein
VPYKSTGVMLFAILSLSGLITLLALPAILTVGQKWFFSSLTNRTSKNVKDNSYEIGNDKLKSEEVA